MALVIGRINSFVKGDRGSKPSTSRLCWQHQVYSADTFSQATETK